MGTLTLSSEETELGAAREEFLCEYDGEGTMIEPTVEFGYTFLEAVQEARRRERGPEFRFTAADLRLPERLLEMRRAGRVPAAALDRIARRLKEGACGEARRELDGLASP